MVISSRKKANVERAEKELQPIAQATNSQLLAMQCDVQNFADQQRLVNETLAKFGTVHILVANAAANTVYGKGILDVSYTALLQIRDNCTFCPPTLSVSRGETIANNCVARSYLSEIYRPELRVLSFGVNSSSALISHSF